MKHIVFSDIHSNFQALDAFLEISKQTADRAVCLGDTLGYACNPNECVEIMMTLDPKKTIFVTGNHDQMIANNRNGEGFNFNAAAAVQWQVKVVKLRYKEWLLTHPYVVHLGTPCGIVSFAHGTPINPEQFNYILYEGHAEQQVHRLLSISPKHSVAFVGHSHQPGAYLFPDIKKVGIHKFKFQDIQGLYEVGKDFHFGEKDMVVINAGSVGQPRDGDSRGCYVVFDDEERTFRFERFEYDIEGAMTRIRMVGLPDFLASRLQEGR